MNFSLLIFVTNLKSSITEDNSSRKMKRVQPEKDSEKRGGGLFQLHSILLELLASFLIMLCNPCCTDDKEMKR